MVRDIDKQLEDLAFYRPFQGPLGALCDIAEHAQERANRNGVPASRKLKRAIALGRAVTRGERKGRLRADEIDRYYILPNAPTPNGCVGARARTEKWLNRMIYHIVCATWGPSAALVAAIDGAHESQDLVQEGLLWELRHSGIDIDVDQLIRAQVRQEEEDWQIKHVEGLKEIALTPSVDAVRFRCSLLTDA